MVQEDFGSWVHASRWFTGKPASPTVFIMEPALAPLSFYALVGLCTLLPGLTIEGYACDWRGRALKYKLNGPLVLAAVLAAWWWLPLNYAAYAARNYWTCLLGANVIGLCGAAALQLYCRTEPSFRCLTVDQKDLCERAAKGDDVQSLLPQTPRRSALANFFFGVAFNPRPFGLDLKMLLYALGAAGLTWNTAAAVALRLETHGKPLDTIVALALPPAPPSHELASNPILD